MIIERFTARLVTLAMLAALLLTACGGDGTPAGMWEIIGCSEQTACQQVVAEKSPQVDVNGNEMWCVVMERAGQTQGGLIRKQGEGWTRAIALKATFEQVECPKARDTMPY